MKIYREGDKSKAVCERDGLTTTTFALRDVPFDDGKGVAPNILVAVCDKCGEVVATPPQSTPAIKAAYDRASVSIEANLPSIYTDALDLAAYRIDPSLTTEFRKPLLMYYINRYAADPDLSRQLVESFLETKALFEETQKIGRGSAKRRLSMKITPTMSRDLEAVVAITALNKTDVIKSMIGCIHKDIIAPDRPKGLKTLRMLAAIAS
ncbi:hypothetical protein E6C67_14765 [Azospirillum sp. TSA2s]|uniref:hypothetical protein n=1 Tax=Azospirillum sp. TSA2s TaxID=709810 RepID=UPI0010AB46CF|nr:hypothetical protein [Azospirillum sp. TSA2s]QCG95161.1 hypothetical protein E6C67_14765 [Azospirillum sp. TSA2s]